MLRTIFLMTESALQKMAFSSDDVPENGDKMTDQVRPQSRPQQTGLIDQVEYAYENWYTWSMLTIQSLSETLSLTGHYATSPNGNMGKNHWSKTFLALNLKVNSFLIGRPQGVV